MEQLGASPSRAQSVADHAKAQVNKLHHHSASVQVARAWVAHVQLSHRSRPEGKSFVHRTHAWRKALMHCSALGESGKGAFRCFQTRHEVMTLHEVIIAMRCDAVIGPPHNSPSQSSWPPQILLRLRHRPGWLPAAPSPTL